MLGDKCIYCNKPLKEYDFYLEKPEGKICSRCIIKHRVLVGSKISKQDASKEHPLFRLRQLGNDPSGSLSHPSMEQALVRELENLLP